VKVNLFSNRVCHFRIIHLAVIVLIVLAWNSRAFCDEIRDAAKSGDLAKVQALIKENPELVNSKDTNGVSPLFCAVFSGHTNIANFLVANKADINAKITIGGNMDLTPLDEAAFIGDRNAAEWLIAHKADVNATNNFGATPLYFAAVNLHKEIVQLLLENKANVNAKECRGFTPLHMMVGQGYNPASAKLYGEIADLLRQHGGHE
jgi:ankyrin repeat protein